MVGVNSISISTHGRRTILPAVRATCSVLEEIRSPVGRPDFKSGEGRQASLRGFDSHSLPPFPSRHDRH